MVQPHIVPTSITVIYKRNVPPIKCDIRYVFSVDHTYYIIGNSRAPTFSVPVLRHGE